MVDIIARGLATQGGGGSGGDSYTKAEIDAMMAEKQNTLVSGQNIKTINGDSLLGSGNVSVQAVIDAEHKLVSDLINFNITDADIVRIYNEVISETTTEVEVDGDNIKFLTDTSAEDDNVKIETDSTFGYKNNVYL